MPGTARHGRATQGQGRPFVSSDDLPASDKPAQIALGPLSARHPGGPISFPCASGLAIARRAEPPPKYLARPSPTGADLLATPGSARAARRRPSRETVSHAKLPRPKRHRQRPAPAAGISRARPALIVTRCLRQHVSRPGPGPLRAFSQSPRLTCAVLLSRGESHEP